MSPSNVVMAIALCGLLLLPAKAAEAGEMSRVLAGDPVWSFQAPRKEKPPYSPVLDDAHHVLVGLGTRQDKSFPLQDAETKDVLALLGPASRTRFGENDDSLYCYMSSRPGDSATVVFVVYPETLISVDVHSDVARLVKGRERCQATREVSAAVRTKGGLRLGQTRAEVVALFGPPNRILGRSLKYFSERPSRPGEFGATQWRSQRIWFDQNGRVDGFSIKANTFD